MTKYLDIYSDLIKLAAQMAKGEGVPDWSERVFSTGTPSYERRDMLSALRMADEAGITHALQLRAIADRLSAEIRSSNEPLPCATRESDWCCTHCGRDNDPTESHCVHCEWSRKHTVAGVLHERGCEDNPCRCGALKSPGASRDASSTYRGYPDGTCQECGQVLGDHVCPTLRT